MKNYAAILLILVLAFAASSCGGSSGGEDEGSGQETSRSSPAPEASQQIYSFSNESSLTPNVAFTTDDEMLIVLGSDVEGNEMPLKSMVIQKDGVGSLLVEFSANGMPSAFITGDSTIKVNKYSYAEGKWFIHFSVNKAGAITDHTVELPQSFGEYVSNLDSWMRNRSDPASQVSALSHQQDKWESDEEKYAALLEFAAVAVELGACGVSAASGNPGIILWACQSAASTTIEFLRDGHLTPPTNLDTQKCFFGVDENGISFFDPVCLVSTGLRIAADQVRGDGTDTSEMEALADKSMEQNRFIGEDPVVEDFPTPLLTAPRLAVLSPQWLESFSTEQDVQIKVVASESVSVIDYEIRSKESEAFLISGNTGKSPSGNFEIDISAENLEAGTYFVTVSASQAGYSSSAYSSFVVAPPQPGYWKGDFQILEEQYISGEDFGAAKRACQAVFSGIRYTEISPLPHKITIPIINEPTNQDPGFGQVMRVDGDTPPGDARYCTQNEIITNAGGFDYIARIMPVSEAYNPSDPLPLHETDFNFIIDSMSNSRIEGHFSATARIWRNYPSEEWHVGSCTGVFSLNKVAREFKACNYITTPNLPKICRSNEFDPTSPYYCEWTENSD